MLGHARRVDVLKGRTTWQNKWGNDGADTLAVAGAAQHSVPSEITESAQDRKVLAMSVHSMMLDIVCARQSALSCLADADADRGSDFGDHSCCMSDVSSDSTGSDTSFVYSCTNSLNDELTRDNPF